MWRSSKREAAVRSAASLAAGLQSQLLDPNEGAKPGHVAVGIMERAKGREFRAVAVLACDEEVIPSQSRIDRIGDYTDLEDTWETERLLL